jgi:hypothetical protein
MIYLKRENLIGRTVYYQQVVMERLNLHIPKEKKLDLYHTLFQMQIAKQNKT